MQHDWPDTCCVAGCYRRPEARSHFCRKCWTFADEDWRAGYLIAHHAPLFRAIVYLDVEDAGDLVQQKRPLDELPEGLWHMADGRGATAVRYGQRWLGEALQEYEARTTREAIATLIWKRRIGSVTQQVA